MHEVAIVVSQLQIIGVAAGQSVSPVTTVHYDAPVVHVVAAEGAVLIEHLKSKMLKIAFS